ncbi:MAG: protein TolQ [Moraxella sp.]|nr:protein TolQ [Moraxella sp.]
MTPSVDIISLITEASLLVQGVMALLLLLSVIGWVLIFRLSGKLGSTKSHDENFETWFWSSDNLGLGKIYQAIQNESERTGLDEIFCTGFDEFGRVQRLSTQKSDITDAVERKFRVALGKQQAMLESGLPTLASIASVSPYIGLFGTVWGIMNAFIGLSSAESVSLAVIAPSIAEALIATAMGLFAAIPASLAFNHFTAKASAVYESRALFCDEVIGVMQRQHLQSLAIANHQGKTGA